jgi:PAS domain S-box-containing protein
VVVVNPEGKRTYCSASVKNVIGYTDEEYLNLPPWELGHPEDVDDVKLKYSELINNPGSTTVLLHQMHHKNGHWIWVESRVSNLLNDPQIRAMIANFNDVTQRVERDQNRRDFIGIVSHELRSPLTNIKSYGQMLLKRLEGLNDGICTSFASKLIQQANYMEKMVVDLTDAATINAGRMQLFSSEFDFNLLIKEIAEGLQQSTNKHFLRIELCPMGMVYADKERLSQVITNMVSNAIKYSPSGGDILISSEVKNNSFFFHVKDSGIGIAEKDLQKVFYRLYRANKTTPIKGLGLGLYICHQIITLHNGEIGVESEEGKGSVFWFSLPLA